VTHHNHHHHPLHGPRLRFCLRATVNALLAFGLAQVLPVPQHAVLAVLTGVVVIQMSLGGSLKAAGENMVGTIVGGVYASMVAALVPHSTLFALAVVLAVAVAPLSYAAAVSPSFRAAPVTAVLVLMISAQFGGTEIEFAFFRSLGVAIGGVVAIAVSLLVFPARAHALGLDEASRALERMAQVLPAVMAGFRAQLDPLENVRLQDDIGEAVHAFAEVAGEAKPERLVHLASEPDPAVLARTLLRLRHDLVMIGRAASAPLPDRLAARLGPILTQIGATARDHLLASANAITSRTAGPSLELVDGALTAYVSEVASLRIEPLLEGVSAGERERIFASGFALQHLQHNLSDLAGCLRKWARNPDEARLWPRQCDLKRVALHLASMSRRFKKHLRGLYQAVRPRAYGVAQVPGGASFARATAQSGVRSDHS
jgi:hypothetical protein